MTGITLMIVGGTYFSPPTEVNYGWFGGGISPGGPFIYTSSVDRIDYSQDTVTAAVRGSLATSLRSLAATGNSNFGWFGGGESSQVLSSIERITYVSDTATALVRASLQFTIRQHAATGNEDRGWFSGGDLSNSFTQRSSAVHRIIYASDTTSSAIGSLSSNRNNIAGTGNAEYGWYAGGNSPSSMRLTVIDRITYSSDTTTASIRGSLSGIRAEQAATGNSNFGWFGAGFDDDFGVKRSTVDRIDFLSDTVTASVRGPLTRATNLLSATGNSNFGWFGGGQSPSFGGTVQVDRINYASDTFTASGRGPLSANRYRAAATGGFPG